MLDIVFGSSAQGTPESSLIQKLKSFQLEGTLYFSYPIFANVDGKTSADALLITKEHGLVAFDLSSGSVPARNFDEWLMQVEANQDEIFTNIQSKLVLNRSLVKRRKLLVDLNIVTIVPDASQIEFDQGFFITEIDNISKVFDEFEPISSDILRHVNATIQRVATIKPKNRRSNVTQEHSYGAILKKIEMEVANLDSWQKKTAISYPEGPQRIRGLAGSGKTIVLALKAAYLHATHPDWNIVVTYYSLSLRQQFRDLIRRFMFETQRDEPDWTRIQVLHSWGSKSEPGFYSEIARRCGVQPMSWGDAKSKYGDRSFEGACQEIEEIMPDRRSANEVFDAVLVDEAQDLPASFFRMLYKSVKNPKRIVWAYDELQNLGEYAMASPREVFGEDSNGNALVELENPEDRPPQDIVLPVCYRNTPWALSTAHGLGFGIYRAGSDEGVSGLVQMFDDPKLWKDIGYECKNGELSPGQDVVLRRDPSKTPVFYSDPEKRLIDSADAVIFKSFNDSNKQAKWIAENVRKNLKEDELLHIDILIVLPSAWTAKSEYAVISKELRKHEIESHLVGVSSSRNKIFKDNSVAICHIFRAKGNEAPMVYFANANQCFEGAQLAKKRNILFTAITRSRAWVRVSGIGRESRMLEKEFDRVREAEFELRFRYPTGEEIGKIRRVHRDRSDREMKLIDDQINNVSDFISMIESGELDVEAMPSSLRQKLRSIIGDGE